MCLQNNCREIEKNVAIEKNTRWRFLAQSQKHFNLTPLPFHIFLLPKPSPIPQNTRLSPFSHRELFLRFHLCGRGKSVGMDKKKMRKRGQKEKEKTKKTLGTVEHTGDESSISNYKFREFHHVSKIQFISHHSTGTEKKNTKQRW